MKTKLSLIGSDAKIEYLKGRTHFDLYQNGFNERIANEIYAVARPKK